MPTAVSTTLPPDEDAIGRAVCASVAPVSWLPGFFAVASSTSTSASTTSASTTSVSTTSASKTSASTTAASASVRLVLPTRHAAAVGIDASSGAAVAALALRPHCACVELCCAPGAKLALVADILRDSPRSSITGVDMAADRLAACRSVLRALGLPRTVLYLGDATLFAEPPPSASVFAGALRGRAARRREQRVRRQAGAADPPPPQLFYTAPLPPNGVPEEADEESSAKRQCQDESMNRYDRVLVDAECSHDGSIKVGIHLHDVQATHLCHGSMYANSWYKIARTGSPSSSRQSELPAWPRCNGNCSLEDLPCCALGVAWSTAHAV
jgi:hypothetical protein